MTTTYRPAAAAERIAKELIPEHHEHLVPVEIRYLFVDPIPKSNGRSVWGRARKVSGLNAYLLAQPNIDAELINERLPGGDFELFVIEIAEMIWLDLKPQAQRALVDHELSHCWAGEGADGVYRLSTVPHDVEEFRAVIERNGMWKPDVVEFAKTVEQLTLADRWGGPEPEDIDA